LTIYISYIFFKEKTILGFSIRASPIFFNISQINESEMPSFNDLCEYISENNSLKQLKPN
jgi:hypothetical protein